MKVAYCIGGQFRNFEDCIKNLNHYILDPLAADVFVSTWDESGQNLKNKKRKKKVKKISTLYLKEHLNLKASHIIPFKKEYINQFHHFNSHNFTSTNVLSKNMPLLFYHVAKSIELMKEYEKKNNMNYDMVILARPDLIFYSKITPRQIHFILKDQSNILTSSFHNSFPGYFVSDMFAITTSTSCLAYVHRWNNINKIIDDTITLNGYYAKKLTPENITKTALDQYGVNYQPAKQKFILERGRDGFILHKIKQYTLLYIQINFLTLYLKLKKILDFFKQK